MKEACVSRALGSAVPPGGIPAACKLLLAALLVVCSAISAPVLAQPVRGEASAVVENGFARLVFKLSDVVESSVRAENGILVITFQRPVAVAVDNIARGAAGYVSVARRDPDGKGVRMALTRKVKVNSLAVAERLFVDLLPENWSGLPPGLPRDVIDELARRAREADKKVRQQQAVARQNKLKSIPLRVATQPTFTRYIFDLPEATGVVTHNEKDKLALTFDAIIKFDLADAKATLPEAVASIESDADLETSSVRFAFAGKVDVRTFREDSSFIVDVTPMDGRAQRSEPSKPDAVAAAAANLAARVRAPPIEAAPAPVPSRPAGSATAEVQPAAAPAVSGAEPAQARPMAGRETAGHAPGESEGAASTETPSPRVEQPAAQRVEQPQPATVAKPTIATQQQPSAPPLTTTPAAAARGPQVGGPVEVAVAKRDGESLELVLPFQHPTAAAIFTRADVLWIVLDTDTPMALGRLEHEGGRGIESAAIRKGDGFTVVRLRLDRPRPVGARLEGTSWVVQIGDAGDGPRGLSIRRHVANGARASISIPFEEVRALHRMRDPDVGDDLMIVTALGPPRGLPRGLDFVEFRALGSVHGVILQPIADDLAAELGQDKVVISRPSGLTLSAAAGGGPAKGAKLYQQQALDGQTWGFDRHTEFEPRRAELIRAAAEAPEAKRTAARVDLARFYLAREMGAECKGVLDLALAEQAPTPETAVAFLVRAIAQIVMGRIDGALKDLGYPTVGNQHEAPLWRAVAYAHQGKWSEASDGFRSAASTIGLLPLELQRTVLKEMVRASIETGDITGAVKQMEEFEAVGIPRELEATLSVLTGRVAEGLGRIDDALRAYQAAADSWDRPAASQGRLRDLVLQQRLGKLPRIETIGALETLTTVWRGDETEVEALQLLARLYTEEGRHRDAFHIMRTALAAHPGSDMTRRIQDEAAENFEALFLGGKGDAMPPVEALALFYDFRDLTPVGRRGDEMIRRLADRLVSVDLLNQAAELLQHQVDNRLQGAARAQVATRLASIYLMNRQPDRALATLRATRHGTLSGELRSHRLMLEARALSELGRHDLASEIAAELPGIEAARLRADVLLAGQRWRDAAEQIELLLGELWRAPEPLSDAERRDVLRAGIAYVLGEDTLGLKRFRDRYAAKMGAGPDRRAFDVVTSPIGAEGPEFREVARAMAATDTLNQFLRDLRTRFDGPVGRAPAATAPANRRPDPAPTGSIGRRAAAADRAERARR
ncbi:MAG: tetratricopeptide repeat protein [Hyphomicrobiales bacterium]|nr:tetratricopeptide repeat protein [Hyphomicrobiales bacterium]